MRTTLASFLLILAGACDEPVKPTVIGTACVSDKSCNVKGQACIAGICTHTCSSQTGETGCPIGYACNNVDPADTTTALTCNKVPYSVEATTGMPLLFGITCAVDANVCMGTGDPNTTPMCRTGQDPSKTTPTPLVKDPDAYCTGTCTTNNDCPINMECAKDYDGVTKCLKRNFCSDCTFDENCPTGACVATSDGKARYCSKSCSSQNDCPGAPQSIAYMACTTTTNVAGVSQGYCLHRFGACKGAGNLCDPCRIIGKPGDCNVGQCFENPYSYERYCIKGCSTDAQCGGPHNTVCDNQMVSQSTYPSGTCDGDVNHDIGGMLSCWPPIQ